MIKYEMGFVKHIIFSFISFGINVTIEGKKWNDFEWTKVIGISQERKGWHEEEEEEEEEGMMRAWKRGMEGKRGEGGKAKKERISASVYASVNSSER